MVFPITFRQDKAPYIRVIVFANDFPGSLFIHEACRVHSTQDTKALVCFSVGLLASKSQHANVKHPQRLMFLIWLFLFCFAYTASTNQSHFVFAPTGLPQASLVDVFPLG